MARLNDWCTVEQLVGEARLTEKQVRGVLYAPEFKDRIERAQGDGGVLIFRLATEQTGDERRNHESLR